MVKLIAFLKRKPGMSMDEFQARWVEVHTRISGKLPNCRGYYINIATAQQPDGGEPLYDGTAELWWDSIEAMEEAFKTPIGIEAGADAEAFAVVRIHLYTTEHTIIPFRGHSV
jgi:uncharacterized protein (TIGR02118 family)